MLSSLNDFLVSTSAVALAEMGDKTQLLALCFAACFKRPRPIIAAIFLATLLNHALAGEVGHVLGSWLDGPALKWILAASYIGMGLWMLVPDKIDDVEKPHDRWGVFGATFTAFFMAEMGDKTQIATMALAAHAKEIWPVIAGTTLGMMIANVPVVLMGGRIVRKLPMDKLHKAAAALFVLLGVYTLADVTGLLK